MSKIKTSLKEPTLDNRLLDERGPTAERLQRSDGGYVIADTGIISLRIQQSPIERAVARGTITEQHGRAAQVFYFHWRRGGCASLGTTWRVEPWSPGYTDSVSMAKTEIEAVSRKRIRQAIDAIHESMDRSGMSNDAIKLLFLTVCDEIPFERAGQLVWHIGGSAAGTLALRYVRSALRVLSFEWNIS